MKQLLACATFLFTILCFAQIPESDLNSLKPRNIGPGGMSGRVTGIDVVHSNPDVMYVGTASGGLWKSSSGGIDWKPIFNHEVTASIGAVAIQQSNPSVVWVGTGEGNPRNSLNGGYGIYKSLDGGKTWKNMGLEKTRHIHRIVIDPSNPNTVYVGAIGSPWGAHEERGVYKTTDGGKSWNKILFTNTKSGAADLVMDPTNPNKLIAAMWEHYREPWFFNSGGEGSGLYITHDGGDNWKKLTEDDGLPSGNLGRIGIAIAASKPNIVYALIEAKKNALYKSEDGGFKWKKINDTDDIGDRPFYYSEIYVDPDNENRVYSIFTYVNVSEDGGKSFTQLIPSYGVNNGVHPDHHAWWMHPKDGSFMIDGNDGGLNITYDKGETWRFIGNLPVAQFYHINVDNEFPYNVYGGMQDNGSWRGPAYVWRSQGIRNSYWQEISFGDGFDVIPDPDNSRYGWTMSQQGYVNYYDWKTGNNFIVRPNHPNPEIKLRFNWNSAINIDPFDSNTIYFGSQFVHRSTDKGLTWEVISPDLTTNNPKKQNQNESGGLTLDATGAENYCTLLVIEPSPIEKDMIWAASDDGKVHYTQNGGASWTDVSMNIKDLPEGSWITQIKASNKNKGEALLVANDYRRFNYTPYAYRTTNYGKSWDRIVNKDDVKSYTLSIVEDIEEPNLLFLGTDDGLYLSINAGKDWQKWGESFPTVSVKDLVIHPREHDLVIGTFGRAAWIIDDIRPLRAIAKNKTILNSKINVFPPPTAYLAAYQQPTGSRFGADALYNGENRDYGAQIAYYITVEEPKKDISKNESEIDSATVKWDSIYVNIYDNQRLIRTLKQKAPKESGLHKLRWYLDEKGVKYPSRNLNNSDNKNEPSGITVKPGNYKIIFNFGDQKSETQITVANDPRLNVNATATNEIYTTLKTLEGYKKIVLDAVTQLTESKKIADKLESDLKELDKNMYKKHIKASKAISDSISNLIDLYIGKVDKRQGITRNSEITVMQRLRIAENYVQSRPNGITKTETILIQQTKDELNQALEKTNTFFNNEWKTYKLEMTTLDASPFKPTKIFSVN